MTVWTNALLDTAARALLERERGEHILLFAEIPDNVLATGQRDQQIARAEIVFGQPDPQDLIDYPNVRWVHLSSAGYTRYEPLAKLFQERSVTVTNSSWVFAEPCAQHVMGWLLADSRRFYPAHENQRVDRAWPHIALRESSTLLAEQLVLILGFGSIGRRLAAMLSPYPVQVVGYRRTPQGGSSVPEIGPQQLDRYLGLADHVVDTLPDNAETRRFFDQKRFAQMKRGARFYNIGRGTTVDQEALQATLVANHLGGAYLDVTDPEPLSPDHPLWRTPRCYITPHTSGGHSTESLRAAQHFLQNLRRYERGEPLLDKVY
jgi:phosphoglycerate dehydrogenase-like enzyme